MADLTDDIRIAFVPLIARELRKIPPDLVAAIEQADIGALAEATRDLTEEQLVALCRLYEILRSMPRSKKSRSMVRS